MSDGFAIGFDLGGTNLKAGLVSSDGQVVARRCVPLSADRSAAAVLGLIADEALRLKAASPGPVLGIGCGIPGIVNSDEGVLYSSPNLPGWGEACIRDIIARGSGLPVIADNDANMYALGEFRFGAGRGLRNMILLTLGTGIGGGIVLDGGIFHGDDGFAGEVGHMVVEPDGALCGCGRRGCWERYAASHAFELHAARMEEAEREGLLARAGTDLSGLTPEATARLAEAGDEAAIALWGTFGKYLGIGIASLLNALGVYAFVIGGGIARSWDLFAAAARMSALDHTYERHAARLAIVRAKLGDDAGVIGAAAEALRMFGDAAPAGSRGGRRHQRR